jgi:uncharacterized protein YdeI (YjbR/CyaY-like superfamily)
MAEEIITLGSAREWQRWLQRQHNKSNGVWLRIFKKGSGKQTLNYDEALDEALCFGWIDGQMRSHDEESYIQRFTPRRSKSVWSKRNRDRIERLFNEGRMQPSGIAQVDAAKSDGRWQHAYDSPKNMEIPKDFLAQLAKNGPAKEFFETLNRANLFAIAWRLQTAKKPETRQRRMDNIIALLADGKKLHD